MGGPPKPPDFPGLIPPTPIDNDTETKKSYDFGLGIAGPGSGSVPGSGLGSRRPGSLSGPGLGPGPRSPRFSLDSVPSSPRLIDIPTMDESKLSPSLSNFRFPRSNGTSPAMSSGEMHDDSSVYEEAEDQITSPFNFTPQSYTASRPSVSAASRELGKRKGHKYKHSSVSHQIFLEPPQRAPLSLPASLPTPTRLEVQNSMTKDQKYRFAWCACHFFVAAYVQWSAHGSLAMTALSRLLLFDAIGAIVCVAVDVMANFEIWKRSSLKHPFGLERVDVLAGFGLSVFVAFMGLDVLSHGIEHTLESRGDHVPHTAHTHKHVRVSPGSVDLSALLAILATLISALLLRNHVRIRKAMRLGRIAGWTRILSNPSHLMTLTCSVLLLVLPLLSIRTYAWFDAALSLFVALAMVAFGIRLGTSLAPMLLMSYAGGDPMAGQASVRDVVAELQANPAISSVVEARFWQVHYGLCIANLRLGYKDSLSGEEVLRMREKLSSLVRNRLGSAYGSGGLKWEISIQLGLDRDWTGH